MSKRIVAWSVFVLLGAGMMACCVSFAQPGAENAAEFQQEAIQNAERRGEEKQESQPGSGDISWNNDTGSGSAGSAGQVGDEGLQDQQGN